MEKKIKRTKQNKKSGSLTNEEKTIIATVLVAIVIMSGVLVTQMIENPTTPEQFTALYILDAEKQANNYPTTVVLGTNSTFSLWVGVENQRDNTRDYSVQIKLDDGTTSEEPSTVEPIQVFNRTLVSEEKWEFEVTIDIDQPGNNRIIFELRFFNVTEGFWEYAWTRLDFTVEAIQP
jgi:uncharacterized membrane protein